MRASAPSAAAAASADEVASVAWRSSPRSEAGAKTWCRPPDRPHPMIARQARRQGLGSSRHRRANWPWLVVGLIAVVAVVAVVIAWGADSAGDSDAPGARGGVTGGDFHSIVADPTTPNRLFVGGHESASTSEDGGRTWVRIAGLDNADAMGWAFTSGGVWVSGHPGITQTTDETKTFQSRNDGLAETDIHALGAVGGVLIAAGPGVGTITSGDEGATWQELSPNHGQSFLGRIVTEPAQPNHLLAADASSGPVESRDGGRTWTTLTELQATWISATGDLATIVASGPSGAIRSTDAGATWQPIALPTGATLVEIDPHTPARLFAGIHDGNEVRVQVSDDGGTTWSTP